MRRHRRRLHPAASCVMLACASCLAFARLLLGTAGAVSAAPERSDETAELTVFTLNLWHDQRDWPARSAVILDTLRALQPDLVLLQEVLERQGLRNQAQFLAESLGYTYVFGSVDPPGAPKRYGNAILTPHRILATHEVHLEPLSDYRVAVHARVVTHGRHVDAYVTHLHHTTAGSAIRAQQIRSLLEFVAKTQSAALVLGGDFNAGPEAAEMRAVRQRFTDTYAALHPERPGALASTLNPAMGHALQRIDYIFVGADSLRPVAARIVLDSPAARGVWASDHFAVWAVLRWTEPLASFPPGEPGPVKQEDP